MSRNASAREAEHRADELADRRQDVLDALAEAREELTRKIESGRVRDVDHEKARTNWARVLSQVCKTELKAIRDAELEELTERVDELAEQDGRERVRA